MQDKIIILDFGSQYTQLIARRVRELSVYCEIHPYNKIPRIDEEVKGVILSGSPFSVYEEGSPVFDFQQFHKKVPLLGICYGAQYMVQHTGGKVTSLESREYGRAKLQFIDRENPLFKGIPAQSQVWMSHGDTIAHL